MSKIVELFKHRNGSLTSNLLNMVVHTKFINEIGILAVNDLLLVQRVPILHLGIKAFSEKVNVYLHRVNKREGVYYCLDRLDLTEVLGLLQQGWASSLTEIILLKSEIYLNMVLGVSAIFSDLFRDLDVHTDFRVLLLLGMVPDLSKDVLNKDQLDQLKEIEQVMRGVKYVKNEPA